MTRGALLGAVIALSAVLLGVGAGAVPVAQAAVAVPVAALLEYDAASPVLTLAYAAGAAPSPLGLPTGVTVVDRPDAGALLADWLVRVPVLVTDQEVLRFAGNLEPTAIPTLTPVTIGTTAAVPAGADALPAVADDLQQVVSLACTGQCRADWYRTMLAALPAYAPIVVVADQAVACAGMWTVSTSTAASDGATVTILTTVPGQLPGACSTGAPLTTAVSAPVRTVEIDGTVTLLRIVFCLVAVLFLSIGSFYGALALTKRMHAAVGFRKDDR